jgi:hypothetical protein
VLFSISVNKKVTVPVGRLTGAGSNPDRCCG